MIIVMGDMWDQEGSIEGITSAVVPFLLERVMALTKEQIKEFKEAEKEAEESGELLEVGDELFEAGDKEWAKKVYKKAVNKAEALVVMTEWNEFRSLDLKRIRNIMSGKFILDTRNILNMKELSSLGFVYDNVGRIKI